MTKYTTRNTASVMHFDIEVAVLMPEQLKDAVQWLVEHNCSYEWDFIGGDSLVNDKYSLRIPDMPWAANVVELAQILSKTDYLSEEIQ